MADYPETDGRCVRCRNKVYADYLCYEHWEETYIIAENCRHCSAEELYFNGLCYDCWLQDIGPEHEELIRKLDERARFVDEILRRGKNER